MTALESRASAIVALLALPDPPDLVGVAGKPRGHRYTQERHPEWHAERLKRDLERVFVSYHVAELQAARRRDVSAVVRGAGRIAVLA
jgi:hypothetical protein